MNNKFLSAIISAVILISIFSFHSFAAQTGDIDKDGKITAADARLVLRQSVGLENFSETELFTADMDSDGKITAADARIILRISVGLEKSQEQNEYELIRSGRFHLTSSGYLFEQPNFNIDFIASANTVSIILKADGQEITFLFKDGKMYLIYDEEKAVLDVAELLPFMQEYPHTSFIDGSFMDTSYYPPFEKLELIRTEEYNSKECSVYYVITDKEVVEIYMHGGDIERIIVYGSGGTVIGDVAVEKVSPEIPAVHTDVPSSYTFYKGLTGAISFMKLLNK